ncbi:hypothetical protein KDU71_06935 [Carboxylicivirga sediminis]|uniref:Uncharacterized protein n=1 Tax=Carboxylicivirga sediminis TaxID=2006564 RepID=A0A941IX70_9BACT|nr:hypothetical protein [Carboxylicivirga sediminis]MBR8535288.1 hypothetical protein [Carboxylicivirga sediminis]
MDLSTTIIGIVMLSAFVIPVVILSVSNKKETKALLSTLKQLATQTGSELSEHDIQPQFAIGLALSKKHVLFVKKAAKNNTFITYFIPLNEVKKCWLQSSSHTVKFDKTSETVTDRLELCFSTGAGDTNYTCPLYAAENALQLEDELQTGNKWVSIINNINPTKQKQKL